MQKIIIISLFIVLNLSAFDLLKQQNILTIKNIIEKEEQIAKEVENYVLTKFKLPTSLSDLEDDSFLGTNFLLETPFLTEDENYTPFKDISNLQLNRALGDFTPTIEETIDKESYLKDLYKRELYREYTVVDWDNKYVKIEFKSDEAKTIYEILKSGGTILENCDTPQVNKYCNIGELNLRFYDTNLNWVEFSKKLYKNGSIAVSENLDSILDTVTFLDDVPIGTKIYVFSLSEGNRKVKLKTSIDEFIDIGL